MENNSYKLDKAIQKMNLAKLGLTEAEIADVLKSDKEIEKGVKLFELTAEQEQASKKARQVNREPAVYKFQKRERKTDEDKLFLMKILEKAISPECDSMEIINPEREFSFFWNEKKYKVVLSAPRK